MRIGLQTLACLLAVTVAFGACGRPDVDTEEIVTSVSGRVLDSATSQPISGPPFALVTTEPFVKQEAVGPDGRYVITGLQPNTSYRISASLEGYLEGTVTLPNAVEGENTVADIELDRAGPLLHLSTTSLTIQKSESAGQFLIENVGVKTEALTYEVAASATWISNIQNASGSVLSVAKVVRVDIDRSSLPAEGTEVTTDLQVTSNGGSGTVQIKVLK